VSRLGAPSNRTSCFVLREMRSNKPLPPYLAHTVNKFSGCANFPSILKCDVGSRAREGPPCWREFQNTSISYRWAGPRSDLAAGQAMRARATHDLWWTRSHLKRFPSQFLDFYCQYHYIIVPYSSIHLSSTLCDTAS